MSRAGFEPVAVIEWDRYCCDTIRENAARGLEPVAHWPLTERDVRDFNFGSLRTPVDLISGGPPCQPFSICGKHRGHLDERDMFPQTIRAVRELAPRAFLIENVKGLTRAAFANYLEYIKLQFAYPEATARADESWPDHYSRLERLYTRGAQGVLRYRIVQRVLNAADYGVPQKRERVFIVGFRDDLDIEWSYPEPTHSRAALLWSQWRGGDYWDEHCVPTLERPRGAPAEVFARGLSEKPELLPWRTVRDALRGLPDPEREPSAAGRHLNHFFQPGARSYQGHTGSALDEPAKTLKAGDHGVPGGENMLRRPDGSVRYFSVRESARLQTFPDEFLFHGSWSETMRQLGNAVPIALAETVAASIRDQLKASSIGGTEG